MCNAARDIPECTAHLSASGSPLANRDDLEGYGVEENVQHGGTQAQQRHGFMELMKLTNIKYLMHTDYFIINTKPVE